MAEQPDQPAYPVAGDGTMRGTGPGGAKAEATYYTAERVTTARKNIEEHDWAKNLFNRVLEGDEIRYYIGPQYGPANFYAECDDEFMWMLQPTTQIGRVLPPESIANCPVHGTAVRSINPFCPYRIDPINNPYKIQCMMGGEWYPSNDYAAGDMTSGEFPDDGNGCLHNGQYYYFLREYAHMVYGSTVIPALRSLSQAYQITGDPRYGRSGSILLARLASEYPNHNDRKDRLYFAKYGGRSPKYAWKTGGMITDLIWETFCLEGAVYAYDGLYAHMDQDESMLAFLRNKGLPVNTGGDLQAYIEKYILRAGMVGLLNGDIRGNEGHHQAAAMACALVLDDYDGEHPNSLHLVRDAFHGSGRSAHMLINGLARDGGGHESPGYNRIKLDFIRVARGMEEIRKRKPNLFPRDEYPDLFGSDQARRLFDYFIDITILDTFLPSIGDVGGIGAVSRHQPQFYSYLREENIYAFNRYGDPRHARATTSPETTAHFQRGDNVKRTVSQGELFEPYPDEETMHSALADPASQIRRESRILDGYGLSVLESGDGAHRRAVMLNYTSLIGHRQCDNLTLEFYARGLDLLPDLGYPASWDYRWQWDANSLSHNTVTVDETQPVHDIGGQARLFASVGGVHVISASHNPYPTGRYVPSSPDAPETDLYERTTVMVDVGQEEFYIVDLFAVNGGEQHDQSWHGLLEDVIHPPLDWQVQEGGTLAGPQVAQFGKWKDRWDRDREDFPSFLTDIQSATLGEPAAWAWPTGLPEGDQLNLHIVPVGGPLSLITGRGRSPVRAEDWSLDYVIARRKVTDGASSFFLTILDGFQGSAVVKNVRLIKEDPIRIEITREDGVDLIDLHVPTTPSTDTSHRPLGIRVQSPIEKVGDTRIGQCTVEGSPGFHHGTIQDLDYGSKKISISGFDTPQELHPGQAMRIFNSGRSALFRIVEIDTEGDSSWVTLDATALIARGPVDHIGDGSLSLDAYLTFATTGKLTEKGELGPGPNAFSGAWLGEGKEAQLLDGAVQTSPRSDNGGSNTIFLQKRISSGQLQKSFGGKLVSIWQYGIGDSWEIARISQTETSRI